MQTGNFLNALAKKIGAEANQDLVTLLANSAFAQTEIPDALATLLDTGLMSLEGAKNSAELLNHFKATILNGIDSPIMDWAKKNGLETEYSAEKSTYKRLANMIAKNSALIEEARKQGGGAEKDAEVNRLTAQMQKMQAEQIAAIAAKDSEITNLKASHAKQTMDMLITAALSGKNYANDKVAREANVNYARFVLESALKEKGAIIVNDNGTLKLKQAAAPELEFLDEGHKPVTFSGLSDQILAQAGCLKATDAEQTKTPPDKITLQPGDTRDFSEYDAAMKAAIGSLG